MTQRNQSPRIAHLTPPYTNDVELALSAMMPKNSPVEPLKMFRIFAKDPPLGAAVRGLGGFLLSGRPQGGAAFDLRTRELVIDRVTARCGCEYEWGVHITSYAEKAGLSQDQIYSTVHGSGADDCWSGKDRAVMDMADELHDGAQVSDETYAALASYFDETQLIELFVLAGWYHSISYLANGARVEYEDWAARFPEKREA